MLECKIWIEHEPRLSTDAAALADRLSRSSTTKAADLGAVAHLRVDVADSLLTRWLEWPELDWDLPAKICDHVMKML